MMRAFVFRFKKNPELYIGILITVFVIVLILAGILFSP